MEPLLVAVGIPHSPAYLLVFWAGAFASLCLALVVMHVFLDIIESDSEFMSLSNELVLATVASTIEGIGAWALAVFVPAAAPRGIFLPLVMTGMLYQVAHYDTWGRYEAAMLLLLQILIVAASAAVALGRFQLAFMIVLGGVLFLAVFAGLARNFPS